MLLAAHIALMIVLVMPDGQSKRMYIEQPSLVACFEAAQKFMQRSPDQFQAIAIGAGCIVHPGGRNAKG